MSYSLLMIVCVKESQVKMINKKNQLLVHETASQEEKFPYVFSL